MAATAVASPIKVQIANNSAKTPQNVWLTLHGAASTDGQLPADTPVQLSSIANNSFTIGDINAGRLFVSYDQGVGPAEPITTPIRNDKIEFTNPGVVNLTSVDYFGIPIDVQTLNSGGTVIDTLAYRCHTSTILPKLQGIAGVTGAQINTTGGNFARFLSPQIDPPASYPLMTGYLASMTGKTITVDSTYYGKPLTTTNYTGTFAADGSITLTGTITTPSTSSTVTGQPLAISGAQLLQGIYTGNGSYTVGGQPAAVSDNDVYAVIYRDVAAGFALGYWGGKYGNSTSSWKGQPPFAAAWNTPPAFTPYFNQYAQIIGEYSDSYGFSFSDVGPAPVQAGLDSEVATMLVTIDSDSGPQVPGCVGQATPPTSAPTPSAPVAKKKRAKAVVLTGRLRIDRRGRARLKIRCTGDPCKGEVVMTVRRREGRKLKTIVVGRARIAVPERRTRFVFMPLTRAGRTLLDRARHGMWTRSSVILGPRSRHYRSSVRSVKLYRR